MVVPTDGFEPPVRSFTPLEMRTRCSLRARGPKGRRLQRGYISELFRVPPRRGLYPGGRGLTRCASACAASARPAWPEPLPPCSRTVAAGRRGESPMEFLTGFTMQMALMGLKMMISCVTFSLTYFNPSRSFLRRQ